MLKISALHGFLDKGIRFKTGVIILLGGLWFLQTTVYAQTIWTETPKKNKRPSQIAQNGFVTLVNQISPAVVNIKVIQQVKKGGSTFPLLDSPLHSRFKPAPLKNIGYGSGFIIHKAGYILTNYHVIRFYDDIKVVLSNNTEYPVKVLGYDEKIDIALLKIDSEYQNFNFIPFGDSDRIEIGEWVIAIGNPYGLNHTVTVGIVSAKGKVHRSINGKEGIFNFIQTDASINPGNSGGPLINTLGEVIGINSAINSTANRIGFAIPINMVKTVIPQLLKHGYFQRSWIGLTVQAIDAKLSKSLGIPGLSGVIVTDLDKSGPALKAGLKIGDIITRFQHQGIKDDSQFYWYCGLGGIGKTVRLALLRNGYPLYLYVKLALHPLSKPLPTKRVSKLKYGYGFKVADISPYIRRQLKLSETDGVIVIDIDLESPAYHGGLRAQDLILKIGPYPIKNQKAFDLLLKSFPKNIYFLVRRNEKNQFIAFEKE